MGDHSDLNSNFLITGIKSDLVPYLDALEVPAQTWPPAPEVDWCIDNFVKPKTAESKVDLIELKAYSDVGSQGSSSSSEDWHIEIEHSDDQTQQKQGLKKCDTVARKSDIEVNKPVNKIELTNVKWLDVEKTNQCPVCSKSYHTNKTLQDHLKELHSAYNLVCEICGQIFHSMRYFRRHNLNHSIKPKRKPLTEKNQAIEKLKIRQIDLTPLTENFEVKCHKCPAILLTKNALATHLRNVHSEGRFKCEICHSVLKCRTYLHAHMRRVHSEETVPCLLCGKTFKSRRYVRIHIRNSH